MSGKNKNYNSIIFLTTLSVYLGLVIVGASPQVSAQSAKQTVNPSKISIVLPSEGFIFTFNLKSIIEVNRLSLGELSPIKISGKLIPLRQKLTDWKIINTEGNQKVGDFLRKEFFTPVVSDPSTQSLIAKELFQSIEIDKDNITLTSKTEFSDINKATNIGRSFHKSIEQAKSSKNKNEVADNLIFILTNTQIRSENNQVFIVTRLPRAAIDSLIK